ncbi:TPA: hypothetical protein ACLARD_002055, partial [Neisseria meningitidis]
GNDGILGFCFWFSVFAGMTVYAKMPSERFSDGIFCVFREGRLRRLVLIFVNPLYIFMRLTY